MTQSGQSMRNKWSIYGVRKTLIANVIIHFITWPNNKSTHNWPDATGMYMELGWTLGLDGVEE